MIVQFKCPTCRTVLEADSRRGGGQSTCPQCESLVLIPEVRIGPGTTLGKFRLASKIGVGSMGDVYRARQLSMNRHVAVKILPPAMAQDEDFFDRFLNEVQTLGSLNHPNIVGAFDAGREGDFLYLAMEFIEGYDLSQRLGNEKRIPEKEALQLIRQVAEALKYAWEEHQILHCDIKPANIMVDKHDQVKITDLGIAQTVSENRHLAQSGYVIGTPHYMSPEQGQASADIDFRSDIYSIGATLYHLVTGIQPFPGDNATTILREHVVKKLVPPQDRYSQLDPHCARLIETMMQKKPDERHQSWGELLDDIDRVLKGLAPKTRQIKRPAKTIVKPKMRPVKRTNVARPVTASRNLRRKAAQRNKSIAITVFALLGFVAVGVVLIKSTLERKEELAHVRKSDVQRAMLNSEKTAAPNGSPLSSEDRWQKKFEEIALYEKEHPLDYGQLIEFYQDLARQGRSSRFGKMAQERVGILTEAWSEAIEQEKENLKANADQLIHEGKLEEGAVVFSSYEGPYKKELSLFLEEQDAAYQAKVEEKRKDLLEQRESERRRFWATLLSADYTSAKQQFQRLKDNPYHQQFSEEIEGDVRHLMAIDQIMSAYYRSNIGKTLSVYRVSRPEKLTIKSVKGMMVRAVRVHGKTKKVGAPVTFSVREVHSKERLKVLKKSKRFEPNLITGFLAGQKENNDMALKYLQQSERPIAQSLIDYLVSGRVEEGVGIAQKHGSHTKDKKAAQTSLVLQPTGGRSLETELKQVKAGSTIQLQRGIYHPPEAKSGHDKASVVTIRVPDVTLRGSAAELRDTDIHVNASGVVLEGLDFRKLVYAQESTDLNIKNCRFESLELMGKNTELFNSIGGFSCAPGSSVKADHCTFVSRKNRYAVIDLHDGSDVLLTDCLLFSEGTPLFMLRPGTFTFKMERGLIYSDHAYHLAVFEDLEGRERRIVLPSEVSKHLEWKAVTQKAPLFVNAAQGDYRLIEKSPGKKAKDNKYDMGGIFDANGWPLPKEQW